MPHKLKVTFASGVKTIEVDGVEISTIKAVSLRIVGATAVCELLRDDAANNSFGANLTSEEGEIEFVIPDSLAEALL